ncbi:uncharacterized protein [Dermacentor andersoni]|uniref:uncharacterized protein n=1 Tax=Dermacentor andersoni TaxID=34620 RepID=UPI003B3A675A
MDLSPCLYTKVGPRYKCVLCDFVTKVTDNLCAHMHAHNAGPSSLYAQFGQHWQCLVCGYISKHQACGAMLAAAGLLQGNRAKEDWCQGHITVHYPGKDAPVQAVQICYDQLPQHGVAPAESRKQETIPVSPLSTSL